VPLMRMEAPGKGEFVLGSVTRPEIV